MPSPGVLNRKDHPDDFVSEAVPADSRRSALSVLFVWLGFIIVIGIMAVGGGLASSMSLRDFIWSVLIGNLILAGFAFFSGWLGAASGATFNQLAADAFPIASWRIVTLYIPIVLIGWFGVEAAIFGNLVGEVLGWQTFGRRALMFVSTLGFAVSSYFGFRAIRNVSAVAVPLVILLGSLAIVRVATGTEAAFGFGPESVGLSAGISLVMGTWIMGVLTCVPDLTRFCRTPLAGALVASLGIFFGNCFTLFIGGAGAALAGEHDPAKVLVSVGLVPLAVLLAVANIWTTNDNNMYSAALNAARIFAISRRQAVLGCAAVAAVFSTLDPTRLSFLFAFLGFMGSTAPALGGVVLGSHVLRQRFGWPPSSAGAAWAGWILGSAAAVAVGGVAAVPTGFAIGLLGWWLLARGSARRPQGAGEARR